MYADNHFINSFVNMTTMNYILKKSFKKTKKHTSILKLFDY